MKIIAIHQPNYMPWLGYFCKIWASDTFVLHDNVQYTKQGFTKRVFIRKTSNTTDLTYLSVPLKRHSDFTLIKDLEICLLQNWQTKHLNKIYNTYHKAPFFDLYFPQIAQVIVQSRYIKDLKMLNYQLIHCLMNCLNIKTTLLFSSELPISGLRADEYNAAIVHYLGGNAYISGAGAVKYQTEFTYNNLEIELIYSKLGKFLKTTRSEERRCRERV